MFHPTPEELQRQISELQAQLAITQGKPLATNESITASQGSSLIKISGNVFGNVTLHTGTGPSPRQLLVHYLQILITDCQRLNIDNVDKKVALEASSLMRLSAVFTMPSISTFSNVRGAVTHLRGSNSLIEFVSRNSHTVLLGKPGTGKTAFSSFLCLCIAGHLTQNAEISLSLLGPLWKSGTPLPLRIKLKEYANTSMLKGLSLWDHLKKSWSGALEGFSDPVRQHLLSEGGLLVLDGLDDISEEFDLRRKLRESILAFHKQFPNVRQLITSRTYVYIDKEWQLPGFQLAEIAPFVKQQQETFIDRWHAESIRLDNPPRAGRCRKLKEVLSDHTDIEEISRNPLILTLISSWYFIRGGNLPQERDKLYGESINLLLKHWENSKLLHQDGGEFNTSETHLELKKIEGPSDLEKVLSKLVYNSYKDGSEQTTRIDINDGMILGALSRLSNRINPSILIKYLIDRCGLFNQSSENEYRITFHALQQYLISRHLIELGPEKIAQHLHDDIVRWKEPYFLAGAHFAQKNPWITWAILANTCPETPRKTAKEKEWLITLIAAQLISELGLKSTVKTNTQTYTTILNSLVKLIECGHLSQKQRTHAGLLLSHLGDPRPGVSKSIPNWVTIKPAIFTAGHGQNMRQIDKAFRISKYLVTVSQYNAFIKEGGYENMELKKLNIKSPEFYAASFNTLNHPQVGVSHYEAQIYCEWLSNKLGYHIRLPTTDEWELSARGSEGRLYPWGYETDIERRANVLTTNVNHTSTVGIFPAGSSPEGCLDLAGNVWEWVDSTASNQRDLRGGSFSDHRIFAKSISSFGLHRHFRAKYVGFRIATSD